MVQKASGSFEVVEGGAAIVTGRVYVPDDVAKEMVDLPPPEKPTGKDLIDMKGKDIYKELRLRGYNYSGLFRSVVEVDNLGQSKGIGREKRAGLLKLIKCKIKSLKITLTSKSSITLTKFNTFR